MENIIYSKTYITMDTFRRLHPGVQVLIVLCALVFGLFLVFLVAFIFAILINGILSIVFTLASLVVVCLMMWFILRLEAYQIYRKTVRLVWSPRSNRRYQNELEDWSWRRERDCYLN
ncbi:uncharacterized protein LOC110849844 [Folsomia candida]|uniref:uncharacterized protein LOC110849844 n=1 Tax=Folsomia candida TaxID=158441 RepID=UPI000B8FC8F6|nr:uncharacterized protein LOC110849844 [Folsomia candida]